MNFEKLGGDISKSCFLFSEFWFYSCREPLRKLHVTSEGNIEDQGADLLQVRSSDPGLPSARRGLNLSMCAHRWTLPLRWSVEGFWTQVWSRRRSCFFYILS